jgi:hypothetical protein
LDAFGADRLGFGGNLSSGYEGRPLIHDWFTEGFRLVNDGGIIVAPLWMNTAGAIFHAFGDSERHRTLSYGTQADVHRRPDIFNQ